MDYNLLISTEKQEQYDMQCITNYYNSHIHNHVVKHLQALANAFVEVLKYGISYELYDVISSCIHSSSLYIAIDVCAGLDAQKVGFWIYDKRANNDGGKCAYCNKGSIIRTPYCPWCGAKMINADYNERQEKNEKEKESK